MLFKIGHFVTHIICYEIDQFSIFFFIAMFMHARHVWIMFCTYAQLLNILNSVCRQNVCIHFPFKSDFDRSFATLGLLNGNKYWHGEIFFSLPIVHYLQSGTIECVSWLFYFDVKWSPNNTFFRQKRSTTNKNKKTIQLTQKQISTSNQLRTQPNVAVFSFYCVWSTSRSNILKFNVPLSMTYPHFRLFIYQFIDAVEIETSLE